jgi:hypothetical protein
MNLHNLSKRLFLPEFAALCLVASVWAGRLEFQSTGRPISRMARTAAALGSTQFAIADFDGVRQRNLALIQNASSGTPTSQYSVEFNFSAGRKRALWFVAPSGGLQIAARDVNGDNFADLLVTSLLDSNFLVILLNDCKGNFAAAGPSDYPGARKGISFHLSAHGNDS